MTVHEFACTVWLPQLGSVIQPRTAEGHERNYRRCVAPALWAIASSGASAAPKVHELMLKLMAGGSTRAPSPC